VRFRRSHVSRRPGKDLDAPESDQDRLFMMEVGMALSFRYGLISLGTLVSISILPFAMAEDQTSARHIAAAAIDSGNQQFTLESDLAISTMSLKKRCLLTLPPMSIAISLLS
jgi:hypothetical protein